MRWRRHHHQGAAQAPLVRRNQRGVALLVVLSTITLVGSVVAELQFDTRVDLQLALNARDDVQAEYSALSALRVRALLLKNGRLLDQGMRAMAQAFGVDASVMPPLGSLLEMVPIECGLLSAITKPASGKGATGSGESDDEQAGFFPGECTATSKSEHGKISLPALGLARPGDAAQAQQLLLGVLSDPKLERFFQEDSERGDHAESPAELVGAVVDWMDTDKVQTGAQVGDEDRYYAYLRDPYRVKNAPFDSVAELNLVHGMNDELYNILKDNVTVYNAAAQVEIGTASDISLAIGICKTLTQAGYCGTLLGTPAFWTALQQLRSLGGAALTVQSLRALLDTLGAAYDANQLTQVFTDRTSTTWYTVEAEGIFGNAHKHVRSIYQTQEGQYYYFRIE
jgi:general secretion pathway protein K